MIESWQAPILKSALDFLFDVGRVVLADIKRQREQKSKGDSIENQPTVSPDETLPSRPHFPQPPAVNIPQPVMDYSPPTTITTKDQALETVVQESILRQREAEIKHLIKLAEIYRDNYRLAIEKYAKWGDALVPPIVLHELKDSEKHLIETLARLKLIVEAILGRAIDIEEFTPFLLT